MVDGDSWEVIGVQRVCLADCEVLPSTMKLHERQHCLVAVLAKATLSKQSQLCIWPSKVRHQIRGIKTGHSALL